jgi:rhamnulokinase
MNDRQPGPVTCGAVAAVDIGATSGRVVLGRVGPDRLDIEVVHRFPNHPVRTADGLHWNTLELYRNVLEGLRKSVAAEPGLLSIGIDSWATDYALMRAAGHGDRMTSTPYHYRDPRTSRGVDTVHELVEPKTLYGVSGLQFLPFNSLYQLAVDHADGVLDEATTMLLVPDLIAYWLTGIKRAERTNASTTGLLDLGGDWNTALIDKLSLPSGLFPQLVNPGEIIGQLTAAVAGEIGAAQPINVVAVGSHDTASAVVAVPMLTPDAAYICSGTWSLVGVELGQPVLTEESRIANFTNERGVDGRIRYLRNVMGMWLVNECASAWQRSARPLELSQLIAAAGKADRWAVFDVDDPTLLPAGDMPQRITALLAAAGLHEPSPPQMVRSILESLAVAYAQTLDDAERLSGQPIRVVNLVGGASQNGLLCQLIADRSGRPLLAGPVEATAIGNILIQARRAGLADGDLEDLRCRVAAALPPIQYSPRVPPGPQSRIRRDAAAGATPDSRPEGRRTSCC